MTMMICPKADSCLIKCDAKFPHERNQFCEEQCGAGYIAPCNIYNAPVDVTLQDFYSLLKTRGTNSIVAESELMRKVLEVAPLMAKALEKLLYHPIYALPAYKVSFKPDKVEHTLGEILP